MNKLSVSVLSFCLVLGFGLQGQAMCQDLPENDCAVTCGNTCDYRVPQTQSYQFDLPSLQDPANSNMFGSINRNIGLVGPGQARPYVLPFFIPIPADYYDRNQLGNTIVISKIPYDSGELGLGFQFQVNESMFLSPSARTPSSTDFTGTYTRCEVRQKSGGACAPPPPPSCIPVWADTACLGANSMGTADGCGNTGSRPEASCTAPTAFDCVGAWGSCSVTCGSGIETFFVATPASVTPPGLACSAAHLATRVCSLPACPPPPPPTGNWVLGVGTGDGWHVGPADPPPSGSCAPGNVYYQFDGGTGMMIPYVVWDCI